jgi:DNA-binding beta-propeller fold protein YncE
MGVVYRCTQLGLGRQVALKLIVPELAHNVAFRDRFRRESQVAAAIDHPNVLPIFEAGEADGVLFISMRLVHGIDLRQYIMDSGRLGADDTMAIIGPVASALDAAHARGLVHRDVKPANVLLADKGERHIYLTDFGLTKHMASLTEITRAGQLVGTADYCSPEQIRGEQLDARADVYSLGCVLYECLTGLPPYRRDSDVATIWAHLNEPSPRPTDVLPDVGGGIDQVIAKAMSKARDDRFASAGDLARAARAALTGAKLPTGSRSVATGPAAPLDRPNAAVWSDAALGQPARDGAAEREGPPSGPAAQPARRFRKPALIAAALALAALLAAAVLVMSRESSDGPQVTTIAGGDGPSGIAAGDTSVWVTNSDGDTLTRIDPASNQVVGDPQPTGASPAGAAVDDGELWVVTTGDNNVRRIEIDTEPVGAESITVGVAPGDVALSDEYAWVTNQGDNTITRIDRASGEVVGRPIESGSVPTGIAVGPRWVWSTNRGEASVTRIDPDSGEIVGAPTQVGPEPRGLEVGEGAVWVAISQDDTVARIDDGGEVVQRIPVGNNPVGVTVGGGSVWVVNEGADSVMRIDPETGRIIGDPIAVGRNPSGIAFGAGAVWVANEGDDTVSRIDP